MFFMLPTVVPAIFDATHGSEADVGRGNWWDVEDSWDNDLCEFSPFIPELAPKAITHSQALDDHYSREF